MPASECRVSLLQAVTEKSADSIHRYGHAASRGLDLRDFSFGLDSGAVYGRALSALVISGSDSPAFAPTSHHKGFSLHSEVSISGHPAAVYSLKCSKP